LPAGHPDIGIALDSLGQALTGEGRFEEARRQHERAVSLYEKAGHPSLAFALVRLADVDLRLGRVDAARVEAERALKLYAANPAPDEELGDARFVLAKALWDGSGEKARARELAIAARDDYAKTGAAGNETLAEVQTWLKSRQP
jgi:tetratricopeptide (TPR) repeat protein